MVVKKVKKAMVAYAEKHGIKLPKINVDSSLWGIGAQRLAYRVSSHARGEHKIPVPVSTRRTQPLSSYLLHGIACYSPSYKWAHPLVHRNGTPGITVHHHAAASRASALDIHRMHLDRGYSGIGYHFYVRKDGRIYRGRPLWAMGGHTLGYNDQVGICSEGNFETEVMGDAQQNSVRHVVLWLHGKYGTMADQRHRDMPGNATACPGRHYRLRAVTR